MSRRAPLDPNAPPPPLRDELRQTLKHIGYAWLGLMALPVVAGVLSMNGGLGTMLAIGWLRAPLDGFGVQPLALVATLAVLGLAIGVGHRLLARRGAGRAARVAAAALPVALLGAGLSVGGVLMFDMPDGTSEFRPDLPDLVMVDPCKLMSTTWLGADSDTATAASAALHRGDSRYNFYGTDVVEIAFVPYVGGGLAGLVAMPRDPEALARHGFTSCLDGVARRHAAAELDGVVAELTAQAARLGGR